MNTRIFLSLAVGATALFSTSLITGCSDWSKKSEVKQEASEAVGRTQPTMNEQRDQYVSQIEARVGDMDKRLQEMRQTAAATRDKNMKKRQEKALKDLESRIKDVRNEVTDIKGKDAAQWVDERKDVDKAMAKAEDAYNNASTYVK